MCRARRDRRLPAILFFSLIGGLWADAAAPAGPGRQPNRLIGEKSPYLLQHAYNPVDWYPWGEEAFDKARRENKPVFLSIGYSTCHWCHVMERESFSNPAIAALLNKGFVPVKVDREERPDIDAVYMRAAIGAGWGGGWPLNLFLTPDLKPFYGGTYFPPEPRGGLPGLPQVLERVAALWSRRRESAIEDADRLAAALEAGAAPDPAAVGGATAPQAGRLDAAFKAYGSEFDAARGGFGGAPKFPMPVNQNFLIRYYARTGSRKSLDMVLATLRAMARGGIRDQLGGGFHRYATDADWLVPHFEKMLYDNAQLAVNYLEAHQASKDPEMALVARETLDYLLRDMRAPQGGFYSAEDADSLLPAAPASADAVAASTSTEPGREPPRKAEGVFYLWTARQARGVLGEAAYELFAYRYGMRPEGNISRDPSGDFKGKNILHEAHTVAEAARRFGKGAEQTAGALEGARAELLAARGLRPRPDRDDKILTSWNGLAITAFALGYEVLDDPRYREAAVGAARFIRGNLYDPKTGKLWRRWRSDQRAVEGLADDYAFLAQGLLDLYEATFDPAWLDWAEELSGTELRLFYDAGRGGFFTTAEGGGLRLPARVMPDSDNVEPGANSVTALNLLRLHLSTGRDDFRAAAEQTLRRFHAVMRDAPKSAPQLLAAEDFALSKARHIVIAGEPEDPETRKMLRAVHDRFIPVKAVLVVGKDSRDRLSERLPFIKGMLPIHGRPAAYVCVDRSCRLPTADVAALESLLDEDRSPAVPTTRFRGPRFREP